MFNLFLMFLMPFVSIATAIVIEWIQSGIVIFILWLFKFLIVPILHFNIISKYINVKKLQKATVTVTILSTLVLCAITIIDSLLLFNSSNWLNSYSLCGVLWIIICGLSIILHSQTMRSVSNKTIMGLIVFCESIVILFFNAIFTYIIAPTVSQESVEGSEIILLLLSTAIVSCFSFYIGCIIKKTIIFKLMVWLAGILTSVFVSLWLIEIPHNYPTNNRITFTIWIILSVTVFSFAIVGYLYQKQHNRQR